METVLHERWVVVSVRARMAEALEFEVELHPEGPAAFGNEEEQEPDAGSELRRYLRVHRTLDAQWFGVRIGKVVHLAIEFTEVPG